MQYKNPCLTKTVEDWPSGRHRVLARFVIETHPTRGQRAARVTHHPVSGRPSQPKTTTYARQARIVDGEDGRTYILEQHHHGPGLSVMQGNLQYQQEVIYPNDARHAALLTFFQAPTVA